MSSSVYLFDTRNMSPEKTAEIHEYIDRNAFISNSIVVNNNLVGYFAHFEYVPPSYLENIPHNCPLKNVTGWDLADMEYAFQVAFKEQP